MKNRRNLFGTILFLLLATFSTNLIASDVELVEAGADSVKMRSLTIYDNNTALFNESRELNTRNGAFKLNVSDIPDTIMLNSVVLTPHNTETLKVHSIDYDFKIGSRDSLNSSFVGKEVELVDKNNTSNTTSAKFLYSNKDNNVFLIGDNVVIDPDYYVLYGKKELPASTFVPSLIFSVTGSGDSKQTADLLYLAEGINYKVDYSLIVEDQNATLIANLTINNDTAYDLSFDNLSIMQEEVIAGFGKKEVSLGALIGGGEKAKSKAKKITHFVDINSEVKFTTQPFSTKTLPWIYASVKKLEKLYYFDDKSISLAKRVKPVKGTFKKAIKILNDDSNNLNIDLLSGKFRVYDKNSNESISLLQEFDLPFSKKSDEIFIDLREVSGIVFERNRTSYERPSRKEYNISNELTITNSTGEDATVQVTEHLPKGFSIYESDMEYQTSKDTITYNTNVKAGSQLKINYSFELKK